MLVLVIIALSLRELTASRERVLNRFMYIGAACFALALAANFFSVGGAFPMHFRVLPLDMGDPAKRKLPMPIIKANSKLVDDDMTYVVKSEVTAIVDVSDAINFVGDLQSYSSRQREALGNIASSSQAMVAELQKVPQILDRNCSGGPSGIPAASNPTVIAITSKAANALAGFNAVASDAIATPLPQPAR